MSDVLRTLSSAYRSALGRVGLLGSQRRSPDDRVPGSSPRGRLFRKYVLLIVGLVSLVLLLNSALDFWFSYEENKAALFRIQQEKAGSAARRIEQFVDEIERQLGWTTAPQWAASPLEQRRFDYVRLLRQAPAITELIQLDDSGKEQLKVSRLAMDVVGSEKDYSGSPSFVEAKKNRVWFSPVYFRKESEPYMTVALARAGRNAGVTVAEVNLKLIWDVITGLKIGQSGYAYVVDREGRLIAHPDISLVLRNTDLANLPQVASALAEAPSLPSPAGGGGLGWGQRNDQAVTIAKAIDGNSVLTAHAAIAPLGWTVFVELPLREALAPLYGSALRTAALLALALVLATSAALLLARRMTVPIRELQAGAARIGAGELDRHIDIQTGDELEDLAGDFNRMAADLQKSYADLEKKVEDRTAELTEALDQQTATAEVLGVINASPGNLAPVFDTMLEKALRLCEVDIGTLWIYDGKMVRAAAVRGAPPQLTEFLAKGPYRPARPQLRVLSGAEPLMQIPDITETEAYRDGDPISRAIADLGGVRTLLIVPLRKDDAVLGNFAIYRREPRPFTDKQIALLQNFAAQAVIAMENARLLTETREALEQQTATAEVLQVINSSPGDLAPVFDAMLDKALVLCEAVCGQLATFDGEYFEFVALKGDTRWVGRHPRGHLPPSRGLTWPRIVNGEPFVQIADAHDTEYYRSGQDQARDIAVSGGRTFLTVALRREHALRGALTVYRQEVRPFTDKQTALLQSFAAQAVIAMENARLLTETREALEQQSATAEVLQVISRSTFDLVPVLETVVAAASRLCDAEAGIITTREAEGFRIMTSFATEPKYDAAFRGQLIPAIRGTLSGRTALEGRVVHIPDLASDPEYTLTDAVKLGPYRSVLGVPLLRDGAVVGTINLARNRVRPFNDKQIELAQTFADQAVIAMENARLITETREALEQQTATAEVLQVINSSPGDLAPVFDAMLDRSMRLCEAAFGGLWTFDQDRYVAVALRNVPTAYAEFLAKTTVIPGPGTAPHRFLQGERLVHNIDLASEEPYTAGDLQRCALVDLGGARTALQVPLRKDDHVLGVITIYRQEVRPFSEKQIALLQNFAAQAVIAMENARLITETREALEQQTATAEVLGVINSSPGDLAPVFEAILEKAHGLCGIALGELELNEDGKFRAVAMRGVSGPLAELLSQPFMPPPQSPLARLVAGESIVQITDLSELARQRPDDPRAQAGAQYGLRTVLFVPLRKDDALLGYITAYRREVRPFSEKEIALLRNFAAQAVIAMENSRLITETREALEQQTATAEVLGVINSSPSDLAPVFDAMLEKATRLCEAPFGILRTWDGERFHFGAVHGDPQFCDWVRQRGPVRTDSDASLLGRIQAGERVVHITDAQNDEAYRASAGFREMAEASGIRSTITVALHKDDALLGIITVYRQEVRPFSDKQIALLQNFAAQAVIAMENARLITETREALEQQTATAEVLQVINSSPGDLAPVFDSMLEKAMRLCDAAFGVFWTYGEGCFQVPALRGVPPEFADFLRKPLGPFHEGTGLGRMLQGEDLAIHVNMAAEEAYLAADSLRRAIVDLGGAKSAVTVALRKDATLLGALTVFRQEVRPFSDAQIALLQNFAAQAVIAMENARLITETREALEQQTATAEILGVINSSPGDLAPVFNAILEKTLALCAASFGDLSTYAGEQFLAVATRGFPPALIDFYRDPFSPGPKSHFGQLVNGADVLHIADMAAEFSSTPATPLNRAGVERGRALVELGNAHTGLFLALRKDDALLGAMRVFRQEVQPFTDKQIALVENFAAQAVIAMENARLITETREALEQQTATAEVLGVINSSPGDLVPVFDAMLEKAMRLCEAAFGTLWTYDGERFRSVAQRGVPAPYADYLAHNAPPATAGTGRSRILQGESFVHVTDLKDEEPYRAGDPHRLAMVDLGRARTGLIVPLRKDDAIIGFIMIYRQQVRPFSDKQIALLQNFAAQAVIAMENARLITETREALEQQTATAEVLQVINSSPGDLTPVFDAMIDKARALCDAPYGNFMIREGERFHAIAVRSPAPFAEMVWRGFEPRPKSPLGRLISGERLVHIPDLAEVAPLVPDDPVPRSAVELGGVRTSLMVPLVKDGSVLGAFTLWRQEVRPFSDKQIALLQNFAAQAVIAMENVRLITELRQRTRDLQESLDYQTATSDVLKVISQSGAELEPVLDMLVETAARICQADKAFVNQLRDGLYCTSASFGFSAEYKSFMIDNPIAPGRGTVTGRVALESRVIQIEDVTSDREYTLRGWEAQWRTGLGVPLFRGTTVIGVIFLARSRVEPFTEEQIELVTTFADQAVIAIENARLLGELHERTDDLQESLEYQTATSDVLKVISQSTFDLQPVLETLAGTASRLCEAEMAFIFRREGELYRVAASVGFSPETKALVEANPISPSRGTIAGRTALTAGVVHIPDARSDPEYTWGEFIRVAKTPTMLGVPLLREGVPVGVIVLARQRVEPFSDKQIELVRTFADQAVIAIENARLFNELRARTEELGSSVAELKMLSEVGQAVSSTLDLRAVLSTILNASLGVTWANAGAIFRYIRAERAFRLVEAVGWDEPLLRSVRDLRIAEAETAMGEAAARRTPIQLAELAQRPSAPLRDASLAAGFHSALIVPLVGAERILGAIILMRQEAGEFPSETVRLMQTLASQSVLAIQNARLFREIADKSEQLALASQHKSQFLANMSHELRTPLNAILGYAELLVDGIYGVLPDRPKGVLDRIQNNGKHLLALINDVLDLAKIEAGQLTLTLEDYSVPEVVKSVVTATEPLATSKGLKFTAVLQDGLPMAHGDARRVSQVLLNLVGNAIKFTDKGEVEIRAIVDKVQFVLTVRDTGPGIADADQERIFGEFQQIDNSNTRKKGGTGLGLAISKRMVEMQGGTISVESVLGQGSTFRVVLPLHVDEMMEEAA